MYHSFIQCYGSDARPRTATASGHDDLAAALSDAVREATYYKLSCGYPRVTITINADCQKCDGAGFTDKRRTRPCTHCEHGQVPFLPDFDFVIHPNVIEDADRHSFAGVRARMAALDAERHARA